MVNKTKALFFTCACLLQLSVCGMDGQQLERPAHFPTLKELSNQAAAKTCVKGSCLYRTELDKQKLRDLSAFSMIPEHLIPGLKDAAEEYRRNHPGLLPVLTKAWNVDFLPEHNSYEEYAQHFMTDNYLLSGAALFAADIIGIGVASWFMYALPQLVIPSDVDGEVKRKIAMEWLARYYRARNIGRLALAVNVGTTLHWGYPMVKYAACKPTPRKIALMGISAGLAGYGVYKKLK